MSATGADGSSDADVDRLLTGLTRFLLLHSAEGAFELRETVGPSVVLTGRMPKSWQSPKGPC